MSMLRRRDSTAANTTATAPLDAVPPVLESDDIALRDEVDPDPCVEEAAERLRLALSSMVARDEWGRELPWRQVARIAVGPLVAQLRDAQTTSQLLDATRPDPSSVPLQDRTEIGSGWPGGAIFMED